MASVKLFCNFIETSFGRCCFLISCCIFLGLLKKKKRKTKKTKIRSNNKNSYKKKKKRQTKPLIFYFFHPNSIILSYVWENSYFLFLLKIWEFILDFRSNMRQALLTDTGVLQRLVQLEIFIVLIFIFMYFADLETSFVHTVHLFLTCSHTLELPLWALYTLLTYNCKTMTKENIYLTSVNSLFSFIWSWHFGWYCSSSFFVHFVPEYC